MKRHIQRLDPSTRTRIRDIASERPTYGYRRVWAILRNQGTAVNQKTVRKVLKDNKLNLPISKHRGRTKTRNLFHPHGPDQLYRIYAVPPAYFSLCNIVCEGFHDYLELLLC